jgi:gamma-polyglutamate synthase
MEALSIQQGQSRDSFDHRRMGDTRKIGNGAKKAALFYGLGFNVVSKTTGCEAMIIHSKPGVDPVEIPIYRPGDKSSIWEQEKITGWANQLNADVLLWECMAVSSDYAGLLQHEWMNDDLSK